jgi:hypothetical protein
MAVKRTRSYYAMLIMLVIALGLLSRALSGWLPNWLGDILWGVMVFFITGFLFKDRPTFDNAILAAVFSLGMETAKLYHAPWLDAFRYTTIGGLMLGYVFSIYNILCYLSSKMSF